MAFDRELADSFFVALRGRYAPYIENSYRTYKGYIRNLTSLDYTIDYDHKLLADVERAYMKWKNEQKGA